MKKTLLLFVSIVALAGCAGSGATNSPGSASKPAPTPRPTAIDDSMPFNTNSQAVLAMAKDDVWKVIADPEQWPSLNSDISEARRSGAELNTGSFVDWVYKGKKITSTVVNYTEGSLVQIKGTGAGPDSTLEFNVRSMGSKKTLVLVNSQLPAGWARKDKEKDALLEQLRGFLKGLQELK